jgi:cob(I)alamin adenosyltransferase
VLYVFQNEVALRVARTVARRLKRLEAKVEEGREELTEADVKLLQGWRWRVLAWSE